MKVLFLTNIPSPYRVSFFSELGKLCDLTVVYERKSAKDRDLRWKGDKLETYKEIYLKGIKIGNEDSFCPNIIQFLKNNKFDIIVIGIYSTKTAMLAIQYLKLKNIQFILSSDGGFIKQEKKLKYKIKKYFISSASMWLSTGKETNKYLCYYGADLNRIRIYPFTSITSKEILKEPVSFEEKNIIRKKLNLKEKKIVISVGQFIYRKGYDILLKACEELKNEEIGIYIIGGKPTNEYINMKKQLDLKNVKFIDFIDKNALKEYYKAADLFVLPTREDIWGLVINEAMSFGLPIVTTEKCLSGLELIQDGENGYIIPVNDPKSLAEKIKVLNNDLNLLQYISKNNIQKINEYTIENMVQVHIELFKELQKGVKNGK